MSRVWPEHEGPVENVRNALAILVAHEDNVVSPAEISDVTARLWRAVKLWEAEELDQEVEVVRQAAQWEKDHPDDNA